VGARGTQIPLTQCRIAVLQRVVPGFVFVREHGAVAIDAPGLLEAERADNGPAVLIRPDGYIAWAGDSTDRSGWTAALARWTGPARSAVVLRGEVIAQLAAAQ
jgi:hypothetical protein